MAAFLLSFAGLAAGQTLAVCQPPHDTIIDHGCRPKFLPKPKPASIQDKRDITALLQIALAIEQQAEAAEDAALAAENAARHPIPSDMRRNEERVEAYLAAYRRARVLTGKKYAVYNRIIQRTYEAYDLEPPVKDFSNDPSLPQHVRGIGPWRPRYSEKEKFDEGKNRWRRLNARECQIARAQNRKALGGALDPGPIAGITRPDGTIALFGRAFMRETSSIDPGTGVVQTRIVPVDADEIAMIIYHETAHWIQRVAWAGQTADPRTHFAMEEDAYTLESEFASSLRLPTSGLLMVAKQFETQKLQTPIAASNDWVRRQYPNWLGIDGLGNPRLSPSSDEAPRLDELESAKVSGELSFLRSWAEASEHLDRNRREREARCQQEYEKRGWRALRVWTSFGCRYMHPMDCSRASSEVQASCRRLDSTLRSFLLEHFVVLPAEEIRAGLTEEGQELDSCQRRMIDLFLKAEGPLDAAWIVGRLDYERSGGKLGEALRNVLLPIGDAIEQGTAMIVRGISAPFIAISKAASSVGGRQVREGDRTRLDRRVNDPERPARDLGLRGPAWRQADEIDRTGW
jgi:hypothetical protein